MAIDYPSCKKIFQKSLATILGQVGIMRLEFGYSEEVEFYLKVVEEQVHKLFDACEKCKRKEVNHENK